VKTFIEVYKGYKIFLKNKKHTATKNETVSISAWTLDDVKKIIDQAEEDEIKEKEF